MLNRDFLLAQLNRYFESIAKARGLIDENELNLAIDIIDASYQESLILDYVNPTLPQHFSEENHPLLVVQAEWLYLLLKVGKARKEEVSQNQKLFIELVTKLEKSSPILHYDLHRKLNEVKNNLF